MEATVRLLIVDADRQAAGQLRDALKGAGYICEIAPTAAQGYTLARANSPDLILLDTDLPGGEGLALLRQIRTEKDTPVLVLSASRLEEDKIRALDAGADDYIPKPFTIGELKARIRANLRRAHPQLARLDCFDQGGLTIDFQHRRVTVGGSQVHLTPLEYRLLALLVQNPGKVLTHSYINKEIWGYSDDESTQRLRVFMAGIRRKIEKDTANPRFIHTEVGVGYRFMAPPGPKGGGGN